MCLLPYICRPRAEREENLRRRLGNLRIDRLGRHERKNKNTEISMYAFRRTKKSLSVRFKGWLSLCLARHAIHTVKLGSLATVVLLYFDFFGLFYVCSSHPLAHSAVSLQHLQAIHPKLLTVCCSMSTTYMSATQRVLPVQHSARSHSPQIPLLSTQYPHHDINKGG